MDSGIPAIIVGAILLLGASLLARSTITSYDLLGQRIKEANARAVDQTGTHLTIVSAKLSGQRDVLTLELRNDGRTSIGDFARMDLILSYWQDTTPTTRLDTWLRYSSNGPAANHWVITAISGDTFEPGILNPGETATVRIDLSPKVKNNTTNRVVVAASNGVTASTPF